MYANILDEFNVYISTMKILYVCLYDLLICTCRFGLNVRFSLSFVCMYLQDSFWANSSKSCWKANEIFAQILMEMFILSIYNDFSFSFTFSLIFSYFSSFLYSQSFSLYFAFLSPLLSLHFSLLLLHFIFLYSRLIYLFLFHCSQLNEKREKLITL